MQTTDSLHTYAVAENYLNRDFCHQQTGQEMGIWPDYISTGEGWLYLTAVLDLADRKVVGWALSEPMEAEETTVAAFQMAGRNRPVTQILLFHSERGVQYACSAFREQMEGLPVLQSMSRKGNCWDNAVAESFFKTIKTEMLCHRKFVTSHEVRIAVFEYIKGWYNRKRKHSALDHFTPCQQEKWLYRQSMTA